MSSKMGDHFQDPRVGSCLTLGNELSKETHVLTKQETLLGRGTWVEQEGKGTQENCSAMQFAAFGSRRLGLYCDGISLWVFFSQSLTQSPSWWCTHCSAKMDAS